jgi:hypothetical protein
MILAINLPKDLGEATLYQKLSRFPTQNTAFEIDVVSPQAVQAARPRLRQGQMFQSATFALTRGFIFSDREKTNRRAAHQVTCLAAAQMAIATKAKRFVPEVLEAGDSGVRPLYLAHGGSPSSGPQALRAQARTDTPISENQELPARCCCSGRSAPTPTKRCARTLQQSMA